MTALKPLLKRLLPAGRSLRRPLFGMFRSVQLHLDLASETLIWLGLYERETHRHLQRLASESASCVDIGAGKGELVCWWLRHFPGQAVVAVEPNPVEIDILRANVAANFSSAPAALSIWPGFAGPGAPDRNRPLATLCAGLSDPIFIKIDIEGAEQALLENAAEFLADHPCRLLIEVHGAAVEEACLAVLRRSGYQVEIVNFAWWRAFLREHRPLAHNRWLIARRP
jgi:precorrin-6B methylase 2